MSLDIKFLKNPRKSADTLVVPVYADKKPAVSLDGLSGAAAAFITRALSGAPKFTGKACQTLTLSLPENADFTQAVLLGLGDEDKFDALAAEKAGGTLYPVLEKIGAAHVAIYIDGVEGAAHVAAGLRMRSYSFDQYKTKAKEDPNTLKAVDVLNTQYTASGNGFKALNAVLDGVFWARDLVNEPPNTLYPESYANQVKAELKPLGVEVEILDEKKMQKMGMGAILAVGMGSARPPRMVIMRWNGAGKGKKGAPGPVGLVGKGVTFDTGGISIKPSNGMDEMKTDMGGSAAVVGTMKALALSKAKVNVVGVVGLAENMPSDRAYRPGDVVTSYVGKTIEVLNTDAEGRVVLADALGYIQKHEKPRLIIDLATLTGAMVVALGHEFCGTFVNDDKLWGEMDQAGADTGERLWRMPLDPAWRKQVESPVADIQNIGTIDRAAGSCTAAGFLEHFIEEGTPWAHMDIAGTARANANTPAAPKGSGTGFGVRVLAKLIIDNYAG